MEDLQCAKVIFRKLVRATEVVYLVRDGACAAALFLRAPLAKWKKYFAVALVDAAGKAYGAVRRLFGDRCRSSDLCQ